MGNIFSILRNLSGNKRSSTNEKQLTLETITSEPIKGIPVQKSIDWESLVSAIIEDGYTLDHFDVHDLRIVAGNKTLAIIYDRQELGLHSFGIYDYCTTSDEEGHKAMVQIIRENEDEAYKSLIIESSEDELWINIADCTNRGAGQLGRVCNQMIEVFEPIILKFIKSNAVNNNIGLCVFFGEDGTSLGAHLLCQKLKELELNTHIAMIESNWNMRVKENFTSAVTQLMESSCTYKVFQLPIMENIFDFKRIEEYSQKIMLESVAYLKSVIAE